MKSVLQCCMWNNSGVNEATPPSSCAGNEGVASVDRHAKTIADLKRVHTKELAEMKAAWARLHREDMQKQQQQYQQLVASSRSALSASKRALELAHCALHGDATSEPSMEACPPIRIRTVSTSNIALSHNLNSACSSHSPRYEQLKKQSRRNQSSDSMSSQIYGPVWGFTDADVKGISSLASIPFGSGSSLGPRPFHLHSGHQLVSKVVILRDHIQQLSHQLEMIKQDCNREQIGTAPPTPEITTPAVAAGREQIGPAPPTPEITPPAVAAGPFAAPSGEAVESPRFSKFAFKNRLTVATKSSHNCALNVPSSPTSPSYCSSSPTSPGQWCRSPRGRCGGRPRARHWGSQPPTL